MPSSYVAVSSTMITIQSEKDPKTTSEVAMISGQIINCWLLPPVGVLSHISMGNKIYQPLCY